MKVLLELIEDAAGVLENLDDVDDLRPQSRKRLRSLLETLSRESTRLLRDVDEVSDSDPAKNRRQKRDTVLERGLAALARDRLAEAKSILEKGVESFPEDVELLNHLGLTCWEQGQIEEAEQWYGQAMEAGLSAARRLEGSTCTALSRGYYRAVEGRALSLYRMEEYDRAVSLFDALGTMAPEEYAGCHYLAGEILHSRGRLQEAIEAYERSPDEPSAHYNLGLAHFQNGDREEAANKLIRGFAANPHIAARLLGESIDSLNGPGGYLGSATYAEEFVEACGDLWRDAADGLSFLEECFEHPLVRHYLDEVGIRSERADQPEGDGESRVARRFGQRNDVAGIARQIVDRTE